MRALLSGAVIGAALLMCAPVNAAEIAYLALSDGLWQVWVMNDQGSEPRALTGSKSDKTRISWFPDGRRLLVNTNQGLVSIVDRTTLQETPLDLGLSPIVDAVVSADGKRIAFSYSGADAIDGNDIWIASLSEPHNLTRLTNMPALQHQPAWSSDSHTIYFQSGDGKQNHDIWKVDLGSGRLEQLTVGSLYNFEVAASPQGDIAFSTNRAGNYELYIQSPAGKVRRLTDNPALDGSPSFSPDGKKLAFESTRRGTFGVWVLDLATSKVFQLAQHPAGARAPAWGPARKSLKP